MFTKTSEYALRAMIWIAQQGPGATVPGPKLAESTGVPRKYLSAIMGTLVRGGLLEATPGRNGGFSLARAANQIRLVDVTSPFEPVLSRKRSMCPFGNQECSDEAPCGAHHRWKRIKSAYLVFLENTTLRDVAKKGRTTAIDKAGAPGQLP